MTVPSPPRGTSYTTCRRICRVVSHLLTAMINKYNDFFKHNLQFQKKISDSYDQEARQFQKVYNSKHPGHHIWRHILHARTFFFCRDGVCFSVRVEIVRFLYAGTSHTFTFYGSLFRAFSSFSEEFIRSAASSPTSIPNEVMLAIPPYTVASWARHIQGTAPAKLHKPACGNPHPCVP